MPGDHRAAQLRSYRGRVMAGTRVEVIGLESVAAVLGQLADFDPAPAYDEMGQYLVSEVQQLFRASTAPDGTPWKPSRRAALAGGKTLVDRGHLRDSYTSEVTAEGLSVGSGDKRARIHQHGGVIRPVSAPYLMFRGADDQFRRVKSVTMPARPVLPEGDLPPAWQDEVLDIVQAHVEDALRD